MTFKTFLLRYGWFLALLIVAGIILLQNLSSQKRKASENDFTLASMQNITRIVISNQQSVVSLKWEDNSWIVNNEFIASADAVDALLRVLTRLRASSPVPMMVNDSLKSAINHSGTQIEVFSNSRLVKSFKVLATSLHNLNAVGLMRKATVVYRLELPNFDGNIADLFKHNSDYWRSNQIDLPSLKSIEAIEVDIPQDIENSYRIDLLKDGEIRLFALFYGVKVDQFDTLAVHRFIDNLKSISYSDIIIDMPEEEKAAITYSEPDFIYTIYHNSGEKLLLKVFPIPVEEFIDEFGRPVRFDLNRLYLTSSSSKAIYVVSYIELHTILRNISHFNSKIIN